MFIIFEQGGKEMYRLEQFAEHEIPTLGDSVEIPGVGVLRVRGRKFRLFKDNVAAIYIFLG